MLSFTGTHATMHGWLKSRRTASCHSADNNSSAFGDHSRAFGISSQTSKPESIAPVKPARILDLLMFPDAVETKHLDPTDVRLQRFIRRRGQITIRPEALVQNHLQISGLAVEEKLAVAQFDAAQSDVRTDFVEQVLAVVKSDLQIVKMRRLRRPQFRVRNRDPESSGRDGRLIFFRTLSEQAARRSRRRCPRHDPLGPRRGPAGDR